MGSLKVHDLYTVNEYTTMYLTIRHKIMVKQTLKSINIELLIIIEYESAVNNLIK